MLILATFSVHAEDYEYEIRDGTITITRYTGPGGDVIIPDNINGLPVTSIGDWAFSDSTGLTSIVIPDSLTTIGERAFFGCSGLNSVVIPDRVTGIGYGAFAYCSGLATVSIGISVQNIGIEAFRGCVSLTSVAIPESVVSIGGYSFLDCTNLTDITIPEGVAIIGYGAFYRCTRLTSITIPQSVTAIGREAFADCATLTGIEVDSLNPVYSSIDGVLFDKSQTTLIQYPGGKSGHYSIPDSVTSIGEEAFSRCTGLTSVTIPQSVTGIGQLAFVACASLTGIEVVPLNLVYSSIDGVLFDRSHNTLVQYPGGRAGIYVIPGTVSSIEVGAFSSCTGLTSVTIPDSVTSIGWGAFSDCTGLTSVVIPDSVTGIGNSAFSGCTGLTSVVIGNSVTTIGEYAFSGCTGLTSVTIPDSVTSIGWGAFSWCTGLTSVYFQGPPPSLPYEDVFRGADNATVYYLPGTTGWEAEFGGRPAVLWNPLLSAQGVQMDGFRVGITGTAEIPIVVEASNKLFGSDWTPLYSGTLTDGSLDVPDADWADHKSRFYRVRSP